MIAENIKQNYSLYAQQFRNMGTNKVEEHFADWTKVQERQLNDYFRVYYTQNVEIQ